MNIREHQLIKTVIEVRSGFHCVPESLGLGIQVDEATYYACSEKELCDIYVQNAQPVSERGSRLEIIPDDGSESFARLYVAVS